MEESKNVSAADRIARERAEQIHKHGRTPEHDLENNTHNQLLFAADVLILKRITAEGAQVSKPTGWDLETWRKMLAKPFKERLVIAAALIAAEIDRIELSETNMENPKPDGL